MERLYFRTKNESSRVKGIFIGLAVLNIGLVTMSLFSRPHRPSPLAWMNAANAILYALIAWKGRRCRAELGPAGLYLTARETLIPYESLVSILPRHWGPDAMLIRTQEGKRFAITVADEQRFLTEVSKRSPQLERRDSGLAIPGAPQFATF